MSKLYFFRHAQASYGTDNYDRLSEKGKEQAAELGKYLVKKQIQFNKIFVGPLERQQHTFEIVSDVYNKEGIQIPKPVYLNGLREHRGPEASRIAMPELIKTDSKIRQWVQAIELNPSLKQRNTLLCFQYFMDEWVMDNIKVASVESWEEFRASSRVVLQKILEQTGKGKTIGSFTSGGTISSITGESLKIKDEQRIAAMNFSVRNTSFTTFLYSGKQINLLSFNELPHLEDEMITFV